jgi:hypothetical protein
MKALEPVIQFLAKEDSQASFRLSQSRSQLQVDEKPDHVNLWQFSQCLLAEAETLSLFGASSKASSSTTSSPIKVKQLDGSATAKPAFKDDKIKGKGTSNVNKPCRYFASDAGCRAGKSCKWVHSWDNIEDKNNRCWNCGAKDHRKVDCPVKGSGGKPAKPSEPNGSGGDGANVNASSTLSSTSPAKSSTGPKINEMSSVVKTEESRGGSKQDDGEGEGKTSGSTGGSASDVLLQEATQLLKSLRLPQVKVMRVSQLSHDESSGWVLLDSGATHSLRPAMNDEEWKAAQPTEVSLAEGVMLLKVSVSNKGPGVCFRTLRMRITSLGFYLLEDSLEH